MSTHAVSKSRRVLGAALAAACAALVICAAAAAQTAKKPITKKGLMDAVKINGLSTQELVQQIERRGVDFEMTSDAEGDLRSVGARPEVIDAARSNYRPPATVPAASRTPARASATPPSNFNVPAGP